MSQQTLHISKQDTAAETEDRFHRFGLISWWDQKKLADARVLVVGAGALGNEIVKNLALLGVGNVLIADLDRIENSNLSRSVLYRGKDSGSAKATVAADAARDIYPDIRAQAFNGNVVYDLGLGVYRWADVVIGGLDNREARLAINRACWKLNKPWIDGAIEQIQGCARVFIPEGHPGHVEGDAPCYECTMSANDWKLLAARRSCNLLTRQEMQGGKTPTTPTISSIIAGVQCQEAVKLIHGLETIGGKGWVFNGFSTDAYQVAYQRKNDCLSHETVERIVSLDATAQGTTVGEMLATARTILGPGAELELTRDVLEKLVCPECHKEEQVFASLGKIGAEKARCPACGAAEREVKTFYKIRGGENFLGQSLASIGVPAFDILLARTPESVIGLELFGDAADVLGPLAGASRATDRSESVEDQEALEWS